MLPVPSGSASSPVAPPRPKRQSQLAVAAKSAREDALNEPRSRRQGLIYIPVRSPKLKELAQIWNEQRFRARKGLYGILQKPNDMQETAWLTTRPLRDVDCETKLYILLDAHVPGHAGDGIIGGVEAPVTYTMARGAGTREERPFNPLRPVQKLLNNGFASRERAWSPEEFARHLREAGLSADFRFIRLYIGFSHYVKSKHDNAPYDSHPGCAFAKALAAAMNKLGYKHLEIRGYFGMLAMGGDNISKDYRYTKIYFENPRAAATPGYFIPSEQSFVYYSNTQDVRSGTMLGRTRQAAGRMADFVSHPLDHILSNIKERAVQKKFKLLG